MLLAATQTLQAGPEACPAWTITLLIGAGAAAALFFILPRRLPPDSRSFMWSFNILAFVSSCVWQYLVANEIVGLLTVLAGIFGIPAGIVGVTVVAWGNSIGDFVGDVALSRGGHPQMGAAGCFGGPMFNLCMALGAGLLIKAASEEPAPAVPLDGGSDEHSVAGLAILFLFVSLPLTLGYSILRGFQFKRTFAIFLLLFYVVFLVLSILTAMGVISAILVPVV